MRTRLLQSLGQLLKRFIVHRLRPGLAEFLPGGHSFLEERHQAGDHLWVSALPGSEMQRIVSARERIFGEHLG